MNSINKERILFIIVTVKLFKYLIIHCLLSLKNSLQAIQIK